ncbi:MAG TPA: hypothetical protein VIG88_05250 [Lysobacter sp.]
MKHATLLLLAALLWPSLSTAQDMPVLVETTFRVKPGKERQFAALFQKTELQRLLKEKQAASAGCASPSRRSRSATTAGTCA